MSGLVELKVELYSIQFLLLGSHILKICFYGQFVDKVLIIEGGKIPLEINPSKD